MTVELLRRAASILRAHAESASIAPWEAKPYVYGRPEDGWGEPGNWEIVNPVGAVVDHQPHEGGGIYSSANAEYIALMHPPVALALAGWLEQVAAIAGDATPDDHPAYEVARAILREEAP